ncbi:DEAD/DEAH box helicase [Hymenobacter taeanensis]|uniref:DEAD/DEAH box helicase n=1 Tax=Hymenobacter taeanensis TaxID=2735321 RepID=A0A6M6BMR1_9BACT|nr:MULTISPECIES: DEAD/DEAH box helicase [Hymenobacter]QJX49128.1 DEAD/DEAH box helicase [Hymenobacter taeanensis]UOQ83209.1 DEAD/DEAH box helicase [Hymenobacter sp. 5414T-23]
MNYQNATPIQEQAIPKILEGKDLIACAQTGTGKTAAYLLPLLDKISHAKHGNTSTLILVPTRELATQIDEQVTGFGYFVEASSIAIYGGGKSEGWEQQKRALTSGADIIIATPGRLIAHLQMGYVKFDQIKYLVLDEADKMMDMGFSDDILNIVRQLPKERQTLLFSATMPNKIREFSQQILKSPDEIRLAVSKPAAGIDQQFYMAFDRQKIYLLEHIIKTQDVQSMVLFTSQKAAVGGIVRAINKLGYDARGISSDRTQEEREQIMREFKNKQFPILVATDVLSRGIDIDSLSHVVNYDIPRAAEDYVHRIGRTARAATKGTAITFISDQDQDRVVKIEQLIERELEKKNITEELGLGEAPEFDPKRFAGLRGKVGGRPERGGRSGGGNRDRGPRPEGGGRGGRDGNRPARAGAPDPKDPKHQERIAKAQAALAALDAGQAPAVPYQRPPREDHPEGSESRPRREPRAPRPEGEACPPRAPRPPRAEGEATEPRAEGEKSEGQRRRKRGGRGRGPRPEGSTPTPEAAASAPSAE